MLVRLSAFPSRLYNKFLSFFFLFFFFYLVWFAFFSFSFSVCMFVCMGLELVGLLSLDILLRVFFKIR